MSADLNDPDLIEAARRARKPPSVSAPTPAAQSYPPEIQARIDAAQQASARTVAKAAANNPQITLSDPVRTAELNGGRYAPPPASSGPGPAGVSERVIPNESISLSSDAAGNTIVNGRPPSVSAPRPTPAPEAVPRAPSVSSGMKTAGGFLAGELGASALTTAFTPTEAYVDRGIPDVGRAGAEAVRNLNLGPNATSNQRLQDVARLGGDLVTRTAGAAVDYGNRLIHTGLDTVMANPPIAAGARIGNYLAGRDNPELPARPSLIQPAGAATPVDTATAARSLPPQVVTPPSANDPVAAGAYPAVTSSPGWTGGGAGPNGGGALPPGISMIRGADGVPIYTNVPASTRTELATGGGKLAPNADQSLTFPGVSTLVRDDKGGYTGGTIGVPNSNSPTPSVTSGGGGGYDDGDRERAAILDELQADQANRRKQLSRLVNESESAALQGHKRRSAQLAQLAGLYDKGTPDYAAYMRGNRKTDQTPEQRDQEVAKAEQERANAFGATITAKQKQQLFELQSQLANETDPKKIDQLYKRIDAIGGTQGRRYQFPSVISGYDELGRPQHSSYRADTYTGRYEPLE